MAWRTGGLRKTSRRLVGGSIGLAMAVMPLTPVVADGPPDEPGFGTTATLSVDKYRSTGSTRIVPGSVFEAGTPPYEYVPSVMVDGRYRMWWCSSLPGTEGPRGPGDEILYATSTRRSGPFTGPNGGEPQVVFGGPGGGTAFDATHTCDPSVLRVRGTYYMYYGGYGAGDRSDDQVPDTEIGVASSPDGITWTRMNGGRAIISPARQLDTGNYYGAGQPSALYLDGKFYLIFTDTTGAGSNPANGAGQYVWRSADPTFQSGVEVFTADGWRPRTAGPSGNDRSYAVIRAFSIDWQYSDALNAFIIAIDSTDSTRLKFLARDDLRVEPYTEALIPGPSEGGPGIVSRPDKHAVPSAEDVCGRVPVDVMQAGARRLDHPRTPPIDLVQAGVDLFNGQGCGSYTPEQVAAIYESWGVQATDLPLAVVVQGRRLQVQDWDLYVRLTRNTAQIPVDLFTKIPNGGGIHTGQTVLGATGRPAAFLVNNQLWPVNSLSLVTANNSVITFVSTAEWDSYQRGPSLYELR